MAGGQYENLRFRALPNTRNDNEMNFVDILLLTCSGPRTASADSWDETDRRVMDKVLSDERSFAYVTNIADINDWWLDCKECNWYKSEQTILSEES